MNTTGKIWGQTTEVFRDETTEVHYLDIKKDGYCSKHLHEGKWNKFYVISGKLKVILYKEQSGYEDVTTLLPGMSMDVPPHVKHKFEAPEDCTCLEVYWVRLDPVDIVRDNFGGMKGE